jgi:hypothetical protein
MLSRKNIWIGIAVSLSGILLIGCGPSPEEQAATAAALTAAAATSTPTITPTSTDTPTSTPTPTPTPIPYDLSVLVTGDEDAPIVEAIVVLAEIGTEVGTQITDDVGQAIWYDLPGETVSLSIGAQGYFSMDTSAIIERGDNQLTIKIERDPFGLLPSEACAPGERLLYIEDLQDSKAQGWEEIEFRAQGWDVGPHPDTPGDIVISKMSNFEGYSTLTNYEFDNAVLRIRFMPLATPIYNFGWHRHGGGYQVDGTSVEWSAYTIWFHTPGSTHIYRIQPPISWFAVRETYWTPRSGIWHQIETSTYEGVLEIWIDGARILKYEDPRPLPGGMINIGVGLFDTPENQSVVYFDDISVCELTSPFVPLPKPESE